MNTKFLIAGAAGFIISLMGGFLAHGILLQPDYHQIPALMRTEADAQGYLPFMLLSHFLKGFAFAWIYKQGISGAPWINQAVRYGVAMILLVTVPLYLIYYAVEPMPGMLVVKQIVADSIVTMIMAIVVGLIYKSSAEAK